MHNAPLSSPLLDRSKCVLVVVDAQEKLLPVIHGREEVVANIVRLVRFCRMAEVPVLATEQIKLGVTVEPIREALDEHVPVIKDTFNSFGSEVFRDALAATGRDTLLVCGAEAHVCVLQTCLEAAATHPVQVVADAVSSRTPRNAQLALDRLTLAGVAVTSTEMVIFEMLGKAGTDEFRQTLPLVK